MGERYSTHEIVRWWLQENEEVRSHVIRCVLGLRQSRKLLRIERHDTHAFHDLPRLEVDSIFEVWLRESDSQMMIAEIQSSRDERKAVTWLAYLSATQLRHRKPTVLGILTFDEALARWCRRRVVRPVGASQMLRVRVLGPGTWRAQLIAVPNDRDMLARHVLCWLSGERIAEYERALADILDYAKTLDASLWRWYVTTLWRVAELHAPHLKEFIMNQVKFKHPFQPIFDSEWEAHDRGFEKGIEQGIEKGIEQGIERGVLRGRVEALRMVLEGAIGVRKVNRLLASTPEEEWESVLRAAIQSRVHG